MRGLLEASADAVVVAAGASRRMGGLDKIGAPLCGRPLLAWTLDALRGARSVRRLIVVVAPQRIASLSQASWLAPFGVELVGGGARRQESVAAGVAVADAPVVLVHDGARPLVSPALVDAVAQAALERGAAIPVLAVAETLKAVDGDVVARTVERGGLATAQTPQAVRRETLLAAYDLYPPAGARTFTDEASLLEAAGMPVAAVPGEAANLKVTLPEDLERAEALLTARVGAARSALGADSHPFGPDDGLALGGIVIAGAPRLHGHSDGDAALHALCDALLGAAGLGDIGRLFPAGDAATRGIASLRLVAGVVDLLASAGFRPGAVDLTITAARPVLGPARLDLMREVIAAALGLDAERVCVKANSGNLTGYEGAGRGISALALASVVPARFPMSSFDSAESAAGAERRAPEAPAGARAGRGQRVHAGPRADAGVRDDAARSRGRSAARVNRRARP